MAEMVSDAAAATPSTPPPREGGVVLETNMGRVVVELYWDEAPRACENFQGLANAGRYDGLDFHRVIANFMVQGGDPTGTGRGGQSIWGGKFEDEITPKLKHVGAGIFSMANSGPNTNGSQFFITLQPCPWLDGKHTIFGRVHQGMRVVQRIGKVPCDKNDLREFGNDKRTHIHRFVLISPDEMMQRFRNGLVFGAYGRFRRDIAAKTLFYPKAESPSLRLCHSVKQNVACWDQ
ncbi:Peptidyl-prolyl cis-trans isomerase [Hondaea fermentalgiana]|uniref:Peptidyl-prolyl cis-trans isomerase n=1 Tax=Hondaea fermentalgiana TaxID=2315210 RepID=A0A2R5G8G3_9STRA|nr:Peptidyl-prolyl cis-trans isomerase [Hondaea fermentalgiana]|eukprot:GBG27290.1 Peptidyl-prolyl cis-trans isomerase [Hondaea fermentalgiana]